MSLSWDRQPAAAATLVLVAACTVGAVDATAQLRPPPARYTLYAAGEGPAENAQIDAAPPVSGEPAPRITPEELRWRNTLVIGGGIALVGAYGAAKWWDEGFSGDFRTRKEGWFGQNTPYGGADKLGHAFSAYAGSRVVAQLLEGVGNEPAAASRLAAWSTLGVMTGIEVLDGYSKQQRFSWEDVFMNIVGVGLGYVLGRNRELDNLLDFRLLYRKSDASSFDPAGDYSGQTYLLAAKASGVAALREHSVLRYFELAVGYGTRGYRDPPGTPRERNLYVGVSLNLSEVLAQTVFRGATKRSGAQRATDLFLEFVQVPGTAALASHGL